jgi:hypothetical protein
MGQITFVACPLKNQKAELKNSALKNHFFGSNF